MASGGVCGGMMKAGARYRILIIIAAAVLLSFAGAAAVSAQTRPGGAKPPTLHPKPNALAPQPPPPAGAGPGIDTEARHVLIVEAETGAVLLDKYAEERMPPASMSKIMTAYV